MKPWILALVATVCIGIEPAPAKTPTWVSLGLGLGSALSTGSGQSCIGARFAVQRSRGSEIWTIATAGSHEYNSYAIWGWRVPLEYARDFGLLYGRRWSGPAGYLSASAGLGFVIGMRRGEYEGWSDGAFRHEEKPFDTFGVPVDAQLVLAPLKAFGLGLDFFGNVNPKRSFGGATLSLLVGQVR